jgi:uncharacterized protein with HEPN domain
MKRAVVRSIEIIGEAVKMTDNNFKNVIQKLSGARGGKTG